MLPTIAPKTDMQVRHAAHIGRGGRTTSEASPELLWARLAPRLAARGRVRISRDGGRNYPRRYERPVTTAVPAQPAALLVYDDQGCAPVFVVDLDAKDACGRIEHDFRALAGLLYRAGLRSWFSDHSPSGGRHVYIPLAEPIPFAEARQVAELLGRRLPTVDPSPLRSIASGCLRPPGARHRSGGHQVLDDPLEDAERALDHPNDIAAWRRFVDELGRHTGPLVAEAAGQAPTAPEDGPPRDVDEDASSVALTPLPGYSHPSDDFERIARTGDYDMSKYASPSEARQAVLWAATAAGWTLVDVARRVEDGTWPGLASFYARYSPHQRHKALSRDWLRAAAFEKRRREAHGKSPVRLRTTSPHKTHRGESRGHRNELGGSVNQWIREWLAAVELLHGPDSDLAVRAVLYALAEAAILTGRLTVEHGNRSLAIATGLDHSTVGRILKRLDNEPSDRALLQLIKSAHGVYANLYELRIPPLLAPACATKPWRRGRVHAIRPVFRELGLPAAFVYAALEQVEHRGEGPIGGRELAALARVGVTATYDALQTLATHGLVDRVTGGWRLGSASLAQLAEAWGILDAIRAQLTRYRAERAGWHAWLASRGHPVLLTPPDRIGADSSSPAPPPRPAAPERRWYDDTTSLLALLEHELGAQSLPDAS